jgi:hypothetical protein
MESQENTTGRVAGTEPAVSEFSRRHLLARGGVVVAGVGLAAGSVPEIAAAASQGGVGTAAKGVNAGEFVMVVEQSGSQGETFKSYGYLTQLAGATMSDLFYGTPQDVSTALVTTYFDGSLVQRVVDGSLRALDVVGTLTVYQRSAPGASFDHPSSFQEGTPVAQFDVTLQDVLTVFAPSQGLPVLSGSMRQTMSEIFSGPNKHFGHVRMNARVSASGIGALTDPTTLNATAQMSGNWVVES